MTFKGFVTLACAACAVGPLEAAEPAANAEFDGEVAYIDALVANAFPDYAKPVMDAVRRKWPAEADARLFPLEVRSLLSCGKFAEAEAAVEAVADKSGAKYWGAKLEIANTYFALKKKDDCRKIYESFFKANPKPTPAMKHFYRNACGWWCQLLKDDNKFAEAAAAGERLLGQIDRKKSEEEAFQWRNCASETAELYLRCASDPKSPGRTGHLESAKKIIDQLLWAQDDPLIFGKAIAMKAHYELLNGKIERAQSTIDDYMDQLADIHKQLQEADPDGRQGLVRLSPMPQCRYMLAELMAKEIRAELKKPKRDDERVKSLMFGARGANGKRNGQGAFNHAYNVYTRYSESPWALQACQLAEEIRDLAKKHYNANVKTGSDAEASKKLVMQRFESAQEQLAGATPEKGIEIIEDTLSQCPEKYPECVFAVESLANAKLDQLASLQPGPERDYLRMECDAIEGYVAERFAGSADEAIMKAGGDAAIRLASKEKSRGESERWARLMLDYVQTYSRHVQAPARAFNMAGLLSNDGRYAEAIGFLKEIVDNHTNYVKCVDCYAQLARCYGKTGDKAAEIEWTKRYIASAKPGLARERGRLSLAYLYQRAGLDKIASAQTNSNEEAAAALSKQGAQDVARGIRTFSEFIAEADKTLAADSLSPVEREEYANTRETACYLVADSFSRLKYPAEKIEAYRKAAVERLEGYVGTYPKGKYGSVAYMKLGTLYTILGDVEKAKDAFARLAKNFPESNEAKNSKPMLAKSLIEMGKTREGADVYREMLRTSGNYSAYQFVNAGQTLLEARSWDDANAAFDKAIAMVEGKTNMTWVIAKSRIGKATALVRQHSYVAAQDALDLFIEDPQFKSSALVPEALNLLVEVASERGRTEKDDSLRKKNFDAATGAIKKLRQYWKKRPREEQDTLDLRIADVMINRMKAEESMGLKEQAAETRGLAAAKLLSFVQSRGVSESRPRESLSEGDLRNLARCYEAMVPLYRDLGADKAKFVIDFGGEYLKLFPDSDKCAEIQNCINQAKADQATEAATGGAAGQ